MQSSELVRLMDKYLADDITPDDLRQLRRLAGSNENEAELDGYIEKVLLENRFPLVQECDRDLLLADIRSVLSNRSGAGDTSGEDFAVRAGMVAGAGNISWEDMAGDTSGKDFAVQAGMAAETGSIPEANMTTGHAVPAKHDTHHHKIFTLRRWRWVAAAILLLGTSIYLAMLMTKPATPPVVQQQPDITPGRSGAVLTLADGREVLLDSLGNGVIANQSGASVTLQNGQLAYHTTGKAATTETWNTVTTPKGRQFVVILPDGSKVWLNAASSIRYPVHFGDTARKVEITGEAYFEVAANRGKPFRVIAGSVRVDVLGTDFNINAYADEPSLKTTLLKGSVRVGNGATSDILQPGQQAIVTDHISVEKHADTEQAIAWKNGLFNFSGATLEEVLRQIARWYDLEIKYIHQPPKRAFQGRFGRDLQLSQVLEVLSLYNIKYTLEGRRLTIR